MSPRDATYKAMWKVLGLIIAIVLMLAAAVFLPLAFIAGLSGQFYRQLA